MTRISPFLAAAALAFAAHAHAQHPAHAPATSAAASPGAAQYTEGEVKRVDKKEGRISLKHGPIANLDMPAMSMVFHVSDPKMLDQVKAGDKVRFKAAKVGETLTVTEIRPAN